MRAPPKRSGAFYLLLGLLVVGPLLLCAGGLAWALWTWVMPNVWPGGPSGVINPGFLLFLGECALVAVIALVVRSLK